MVDTLVAVFSLIHRLRRVWLLLFAVLLVNGCGDDRDQSVKRLFTVGLITNNPNGLRNVQGFRDGLHTLRYREGDNVTYLHRGKPTPNSELVATIEAMVAEGAELIFTAGTPTGVAAAEATRKSAVPVVFGVVADPVAAGVITDLNRPGGNMTGVMLSQNQTRRLELVRTVVPDARRVLVPYDPDDAAPVSALAQIRDVAGALGFELVNAHARNDHEVTAMLAHFPTYIDAVFMLPDSTVNRRIRDLLVAALERRLPVSGPSAAQVEAGAVMSYGIVHHEVGIQAAHIADRILRGASPATIPVETADFFLTLNVAAANRIGLELPEEVLQQADRIVRQDGFVQ